MKVKPTFLKRLVAGIFIVSFTVALISSSGIAGGLNANTDNVMTQKISSKLIRLHVIANSDSPQDQALKLRVRDAITEVLGSKFENINDVSVSRQFIKDNLKYIEGIARQEIQNSNKNYNVTAKFGRFPFPVKTYGYVTLPAGEYEALRIIIGSGRGANWWCVLFPPLCFVDITQETKKDEAKLAMSKVLTPQEMAAIERIDVSEEVPIEIRFKILDWLKETGEKIDKTIKLAFR